MLLDGDPKIFASLHKLEPYPDVELEKEECTNHVHRRMSTALCKLVEEEKAEGVTIWGRGKGKPNRNVIEKLTGYNGKAIRGNPVNLDATH